MQFICKESKACLPETSTSLPCSTVSSLGGDQRGLQATTPATGEHQEACLEVEDFEEEGSEGVAGSEGQASAGEALDGARGLAPGLGRRGLDLWVSNK